MTGFPGELAAAQVRNAARALDMLRAEIDSDPRARPQPVTIAFDVPGVPAPQGSKSAVVRGGRAVVIESSTAAGRERHTNWRTAVADKAREQAEQHGMFNGPLAVRVAFRFPMPVSRPKRDREAGQRWKDTAPDLDKLLRATFDGIAAGGLISNDARIARTDASKWEVTGWTGATISIGRLA